MSRKAQRNSLIYLYDLPKSIHEDSNKMFGAGVTATELARLIYDTTGVLIEKMPIINYYKDMFKPFYSAYVSFENAHYDHNRRIPADQRPKNFTELSE